MEILNIRLVNGEMVPRAQVICAKCGGTGTEKTVPARIVSTEVLHELSVQDEIRQLSYADYVERKNLSWFQRVDQERFFELGSGVIGLIFAGVVFFLQWEDAGFLMFGFLLILLLWIPVSSRSHAAFRREQVLALAESRELAEKMYQQILRENGVPDPARAVLYIPGKTKREEVEEGSVLVMEAPT